MTTFTLRSSLALGVAVLGVPAWGADLELKLNIPRLAVAEYHRPYVSVWLEKATDQSFAGHLAVLYDLKKSNNGGSKWLKDMRQWWRKGGRDLALPADGISGATRAPGEAVLNLSKAPALANLAPGSYEVVVEVAREAGGREVVRLPLQWPPKPNAESAVVQGEHEVGALSLAAKP